MSIKYLWYLKRAPINIEKKTKFGQNVDADHQFKPFERLESQAEFKNSSNFADQNSCLVVSTLDQTCESKVQTAPVWNASFGSSVIVETHLSKKRAKIKTV